MYEAYKAIFERLGVNFRIVQADSGNIGGNQSQEFHILADSGEDHSVSFQMRAISLRTSKCALPSMEIRR